MKKNALVIGCGQIGALYDLEKPELLLSHAKGYDRSELTTLRAVVDPDRAKAEKVAAVYGCSWYQSLTEIDLGSIDIISICTPTSTHFNVLNELHSMGYKGLIILEKPVAANTEEIQAIQTFEQTFLDNIYINYIRRYDPVYSKILQELKDEGVDTIKKVVCNYFGGFEHNGIHAVNLLNFLFGITPEILFDTQKTTILRYGNTEVVMNLLDTDYLNFELTLFTKTKKIVFDRLGYHVGIYQKAKSKKFDNIYETKLSESHNILNGYVLHLIDKVLNKAEDIPTVFEGITDFHIARREKC